LARGYWFVQKTIFSSPIRETAAVRQSFFERTNSRAPIGKVLSVI